MSFLSQFFCGFAQACQDRVDLDAFGLAQALEAGVQTAYQAVLEPVEGTVLTVAREAASRAMAIAPGADSVVAVMAEALEAARAALRQTPELLPTLKRVGVVDAGGQGLVCVYKGFLDALRGEGRGYKRKRFQGWEPARRRLQTSPFPRGPRKPTSAPKRSPTATARRCSSLSIRPKRPPFGRTPSSVRRWAHTATRFSLWPTRSSSRSTFTRRRPAPC